MYYNCTMIRISISFICFTFLANIFAQPGEEAIDISKIEAPGMYGFTTVSSFGQFQYIKSDTDGDGDVDRISTYTYDANGNRTREETDTDGDGVADYIETYTYDANGNRTREETDTNGDGEVDRISTYTYDANGNQTREETDENGNGVADYIIIYNYSNKGYCATLGDGVAHKLEVFIPESGVWSFSLCGASFQNNLALSATEQCDSNVFFASDGCTSGDASAEVRIDSAGTYFLTVAGKGVTDKGAYTLDIKRLGGLNVFETQNDLISIYPNPAQHQITINHANLSIDSYVILNSLGQNIIENTLESNVVDVSALPKGSYVLMLKDLTGNQTYFKKFLK